MIKALIIEDEPKTMESLVYLLNKYCPDMEVVARANDFETGYKFILEQKPSVIFADIQLNAAEGTGIDLINTLQLSHTAIIFISGHKEYAVDAFRLNAVDYLLKPIRIDHLIEAVKKARTYLEQKSTEISANAFTKKQDSFHIPVKEGFMILRHEDIIRCEADGAYTHFFIKGKDGKITSSINIGQVEQQLGPDFLRVHKSHIIQKSYVVSYSKTEGLIVKMSDQALIPVSRNQKDQFYTWLG